MKIDKSVVDAVQNAVDNHMGISYLIESPHGNMIVIQSQYGDVALDIIGSPIATIIKKFYVDGTSVILIRSNVHDELLIDFIVAHELGHLALHKHEGEYVRKVSHEIEADMFALKCGLTIYGIREALYRLLYLYGDDTELYQRISACDNIIERR